jgi:hypothetical protein
MLWLLRHLMAIVILPFSVAVAIPLWLARRNDTPLALGAGAGRVAVQALAIAILILGVMLFDCQPGPLRARRQGHAGPLGPATPAGGSRALPIRA